MYRVVPSVRSQCRRGRKASVTLVNPDITGLRRAALVAARRDGKWMHYRISDPTDAKAREVLDTTLEMIEADPEMKADRKRLVNVCCGTSVQVQIGKS